MKAGCAHSSPRLLAPSSGPITRCVRFQHVQAGLGSHPQEGVGPAAWSAASVHLGSSQEGARGEENKLAAHKTKGWNMGDDSSRTGQQGAGSTAAGDGRR